MVLYNIENVIEGMIVGQSLYSRNGKMILASGFRLNNEVIKLLKKYDYASIYIEEPGTETVIPEDIINAQIRRETEIDLAKMNDLSSSVIEVREESADTIRKIVEDKSGQFKAIMIKPNIRQRLSSIIESLLSNPRSIVNLSSLKTCSGYRYQHALNTTVIALHLGIKFNYTPKELEELGMGVILMDMGMIAVPKRIQEKEGPLTPEELTIVHEHPNYSYIILQKNQEQLVVSNSVALQHHERQDGTGYPRGIKGTREKPIKRSVAEAHGLIHRYAEIAAVADAFDAMTSNRPYASAKTPAQAIEELIHVADTQLNQSIVQMLVDTTLVYPVGARIEIDNSLTSDLIGCQGVIAEVNEEALNKPVILLTRSRLGQTFSPPVKIDMGQKDGFSIKIII